MRRIAVIGVALLGFVRGVSAATINVDTLVDDNTVNGNCTLREAVISANTDTAIDACTAGIGVDTINVPTGTITLSIAGTGDNNASTGSLDILAGVTIIGAGASNTEINGGGLDQVFLINPFGGAFVSVVNIRDLAIRGG